MRLTTQNVIYAFDKNDKPALKVSAPATVCISTLDCYSNQLTGEDIPYSEVNRKLINPATGPIYIENACIGDTLKVSIDKIEVADSGVLSCGPGNDPIGCLLNKSSFKIASIEGDCASFLGKYKIPLNKMVGVIGVAPGCDEPIPTPYPGKHGGNMDCLLITEGATLYLPVAVSGGLLALGDVHAIMGDGEVGGSGLEVAAKVSVTIDVIKGKVPAFPMVENDELFAVIASMPTSDEAIKEAVQQMYYFLEPRTNLHDNDLAMLISMAGHVRICQIVDPLITARCEFPKKYMDIAEF